MQSTQDQSIERLRTIARRAMLARNFEPDFSSAAQAQLRGISAPAREAGLEDLRDLLWCSIDNDDSKDLDQLSVAVAGPGQRTRLLLAIADVDATVARGSPIDAHAEHNTTSVYTVPQVFPMLPLRLSTDLTSLNPGADRPALIVDLTVESDGTVADEALYRALVRNRAQLAYGSVAAWLGGGAPPAALAAVPGLDENLRLQARSAAQLRTRRLTQGALVLETSEPRPVFAQGRLLDLRPAVPNAAERLIEDLMVAANGAVARFLAARGFPVLRRVLETPERWGRIVELARDAGGALPAQPDAHALNEFLLQRQAADPERFADLSLSIVKLLGRGQYVLRRGGEPSEGHFALAVSDYAHSTAPNRRFPDLLTQRLLKAALARRTAPYEDAALTALASHCTLQEDAAAKVERLVEKSAAALLLAGREGESFDAIVTGAAPKGTWVRITSPMTEGRVILGFEHLQVGDRVRVTLAHLDVERGFIDFVRAGS